MSVAGKTGTSGNRRQFIRHPADIPLEVETVAHAEACAACDVGHGGIAFTHDEPIQPGTEVSVHIPQLRDPFHAKGRVAWCRRARERFRIGVRFFDERDAFRSRMVEQVCAIESYRQRVLRREGRELSGAEAAREWVDKYAASFPPSG